MIERKQREGKTLLGSSRAIAIRLIRIATAILLFGASFTAVYGQAPDTVNAPDKKTQQSPQQQSVQRDQAYVRQLLQRGTSDAKVESVLQLSTRFTSFNPTGDFHAYALSLIAKEKTALKQSKLTQQAGVGSQTAPTAAVSDSSPVPPSAIALAPSNPVGISNVKSSQESNRESTQDAISTSTPDNNQASVSNSSPAGFGGGLFLPAASAPSNGGGAVQSTSRGNVRTLRGRRVLAVLPPTDQVLAALRRTSRAIQIRSTLTKALGQGPSVRDPGATCSRLRPP